MRTKNSDSVFRGIKNQRKIGPKTKFTHLIGTKNNDFKFYKNKKQRIFFTVAKIKTHLIYRY